MCTKQCIEPMSLCLSKVAHQACCSLWLKKQPLAEAPVPHHSASRSGALAYTSFCGYFSVRSRPLAWGRSHSLIFLLRRSQSLIFLLLFNVRFSLRLARLMCKLWHITSAPRLSSSDVWNEGQATSRWNEGQATSRWNEGQASSGWNEGQATSG